MTGDVLDGRYEIVAAIAEGGMGAVFRARRRMLGDEVAIKIMRQDLAADPGPRERFFRESRACARLRHPNIVSIFDFNLDAEGRPFLVMELLSGPSLREELAARGPLPLEDVQQIMLPICGALQFAHSCNILHRDLKPANIVAHDFGGGARVHKIVDFGLASVRDSTDETRLTGNHQFLGTIAYAPPEQLSGGVPDARSDVYALAVVIFELLTGRVPFEGTDAMTIVTAHMMTPPPAASSLRPGLPVWIDLALARAMAKSPDDRYQDMAAFGRALAGGETSARGAATPGAGSGTTLLGTYELGRRLGPGRLGSDVFAGNHRALGHPVAIRLLRRGPERNWDAVRGRFLREAKTLQVAHPSIMQVRDFGEEGDLLYLVTDFVEGPSLRELLQTDGPLAWPRLRPLLSHLLEAARVLHRRGGLLCGLSPEIIRVTRDEDGERLMLSSAGIWHAADLLATMREQTVRGSEIADVELRYVAPELLTGRDADVRSDVFTLGVLAYEMAAGVVPYDGASMPALLGAMLRGHPSDPRTLQPSLPETAASAILRALAPQATDRFDDVRQFAAAAGVGA
ncbi:MAG TPA: serine/threonine-protein kinase [Vicinamibacterales bacterium]|nr:serine/threonine-protein kinase [Vicinamibacterales bacterium]